MCGRFATGALAVLAVGLVTAIYKRAAGALAVLTVDPPAAIYKQWLPLKFHFQMCFRLKQPVEFAYKFIAVVYFTRYIISSFLSRVMTSPCSRRRALAGSGSVILGALSGCNQLPFSSSSPSQLEILPSNATAEPQGLEIELLRTDEETRDEAVVFDRFFELEASDTGGIYQFPDPPVVDEQRYLIRASLGGYRDVTQHYHYFPNPDDSVEGPRLLEVAVYKEDELVRPYIDYEQYSGRGDPQMNSS